MSLECCQHAGPRLEMLPAFLPSEVVKLLCCSGYFYCLFIFFDLKLKISDSNLPGMRLVRWEREIQNTAPDLRKFAVLLRKRNHSNYRNNDRNREEHSGTNFVTPTASVGVRMRRPTQD